MNREKTADGTWLFTMEDSRREAQHWAEILPDGSTVRITWLDPMHLQLERMTATTASPAVPAAPAAVTSDGLDSLTDAQLAVKAGELGIRLKGGDTRETAIRKIREK